MDDIDYSEILMDAFFGIYKQALDYLARNGASEFHYFYLNIDTTHEGVNIPAFLKAQYPQEMRMVLQHRFLNLLPDENGFAVDLQFNGVWSSLYVPYDAILVFVDPPANFVLSLPEGVIGLELDEPEAEDSQETDAPHPPKTQGGPDTLKIPLNIQKAKTSKADLSLDNQLAKAGKGKSSTHKPTSHKPNGQNPAGQNPATKGKKSAEAAEEQKIIAFNQKEKK